LLFSNALPQFLYFYFGIHPLGWILWSESAISSLSIGQKQAWLGKTSQPRVKSVSHHYNMRSCWGMKHTSHWASQCIRGCFLLSSVNVEYIFKVSWKKAATTW